MAALAAGRVLPDLPGEALAAMCRCPERSTAGARAGELAALMRSRARAGPEAPGGAAPRSPAVRWLIRSQSVKAPELRESGHQGERSRRALLQFDTVAHVGVQRLTRGQASVAVRSVPLLTQRE
jgi:hypothetical protein